MTTHRDERPFMCPYCQKTFKTSGTCTKHIATHRNQLTTVNQVIGRIALQTGFLPSPEKFWSFSSVEKRFYWSVCMEKGNNLPDLIF